MAPRKEKEGIKKPERERHPQGVRTGNGGKKEHKRGAVKSIIMVIIMLLPPNPLKLF